MSGQRSTGDFRILIGKENAGVYSGVEFGNSAQCILLSRVSGMEIPPIRNNYGDWSGKDGGYMSSQLYGGRILTISGFYWDDYASCVVDNEIQAYSIRERLVNALTIRKLYPIFIKFMNTKTFFTQGYLTDFKMDYDNYKVGEYQVTFFCPDYALSVADIYGDPESIYRYASLNKEKPGGHLLESDLGDMMEKPHNRGVLFKEGRFTTQINYKGLIPCYPRITLKGPATNPTFINRTTNQQFKIGPIVKGDGTTEDFVVAAGSTLVVDMDKRQATYNGKSISYYINPLSEWWALVPGENRVYYITDSTLDNESAILRYTDNYQGV